MRMHRKDNLEERLAACSDILIMPDLSEKNMKKAAQIKEYSDFTAMFSNAAPVHLEIGCGKGAFAIGMAKLHSDINFIAVERVSNVIITACESAKKAHLNNLFFINCPAEVLPKYIMDNCIQRIYLNFSDPLPKLGYSAQRLTHPRLLTVYSKMLCSGGEIWQKTDNEQFFDFSLNSYREVGFEVVEECRDLALHPFEGNVITEYEAKFMADGKKIFRAVVKLNK